LFVKWEYDTQWALWQIAAIKNHTFHQDRHQEISVENSQFPNIQTACIFCVYRCVWIHLHEQSDKFVWREREKFVEKSQFLYFSTENIRNIISTRNGSSLYLPHVLMRGQELFTYFSDKQFTPCRKLNFSFHN